MNKLSMMLTLLAKQDDISVKKRLLDKLSDAIELQTTVCNKIDPVYRALVEDFKKLAEELGQTEIVKRIKDESIDFECIPIVVALNTIPGIYCTGMSGNGSKHFNYYVWFDVIDPDEYGIDAVLRAIDKRYGGMWSWTLAIEITDSKEKPRIYAIKGPDYAPYYTGIEGDTRLLAEVLRIAYNLLDISGWQKWVNSIKKYNKGKNNNAY